MTQRLLVLGAGGHGIAVAEAAILSRQFGTISFLDKKARGSVGEWTIIGTPESLLSHIDQFDAAIAAVGNCDLRTEWLGAIRNSGLRSPPIIHPAATVSRLAVIEQGCAIMPGAVVGPRTSIGLGSIINCNATVDHDCHLGDYVHLGVGVHLAGGTVVGNNSFLQAGCCAGYGVSIPAGTLASPGTIFG